MSIGQRWSEAEMQKLEVIFCRALSVVLCAPAMAAAHNCLRVMVKVFQALHYTRTRWA